MGRRAASILVPTLLTALLAGACQSPSTDTGQAGGAPTTAPAPTPSPSATASPPAAGVCRSGSVDTVDKDIFLFGADPISCEQPHQTETAYAAALSGSATTPEGEAEEAYGVCATEVKQFLGGDVHLARAEFMVAMDKVFDGDRWFRCELLETTDGAHHVKTRTGSMRDGLKGKRPLALSCANFKESKDGSYITGVTYTPCAKPHEAEFAGLYRIPSSGKVGPNTLADQCAKVGGKYVGAGDLRNAGGYGWFPWGPNNIMYDVGDRTTRCFVYAYPKRKSTGSVKA